MGENVTSCGSHVSSRSSYIVSLLSLLVLTVITVAASRLDFGSMNFIIAMLIATVKATVVAMFFMHLKYEHTMIRLCLIVPVILLLILLGGCFIDILFRPKLTVW